MFDQLTDIEKQLADLMSEISGEAYCAGWMMNLEYALWDAVINGERHYGRCHISEPDIKKLTELSAKCKCWIYFDASTEETAIPLDEWHQRFESHVTK